MADIKTDVNELVDWLANGGDAVVRFTKADGTERTMHCTQKGIIEADRYWGKRDQIVHVWDIAEDYHRAFTKERVIDWYIAS